MGSTLEQLATHLWAAVVPFIPAAKRVGVARRFVTIFETAGAQDIRSADRLWNDAELDCQVCDGFGQDEDEKPCKVCKGKGRRKDVEAVEPKEEVQEEQEERITKHEGLSPQAARAKAQFAIEEILATLAVQVEDDEDFNSIFQHLQAHITNIIENIIRAHANE